MYCGACIHTYNQNGQMTCPQSNTLESESKLFPGDTSARHSFTRTYNGNEQSLDLTEVINLGTQSSTSSAEDKREEGGLIPISISLANISPRTKSLQSHGLHMSITPIVLILSLHHAAWELNL